MAHASESGLQAHSIGPEFPWLVVGTEDAERNTRWYAWNTITGDRYPTRATYSRAQMDVTADLTAEKLLAQLAQVDTPALYVPQL
jgi:hypothetical protein